jgi:large subunit ribosomal protein LP1
MATPETQELLTTYACLILHDDKAELTEDSINSLIKAAGCSVEPYWPKLFVELLSGCDVDELLLSAGAAGPAAGAAGPAAAGEAAGAEAKEEAAAEESEEEEDEDVRCSRSSFTLLTDQVASLGRWTLISSTKFFGSIELSINLFDKQLYGLSPEPTHLLTTTLLVARVVALRRGGCHLGAMGSNELHLSRLEYGQGVEIAGPTFMISVTETTETGID